MLVCLLVGAGVGCFALPFWDEIAWPTEEIRSRGTAEGLYWGFFVAVPSGKFSWPVAIAQMTFFCHMSIHLTGRTNDKGCSIDCYCLFLRYFFP